MALQTYNYLTPISSMPQGRVFGDTPSFTSMLVDAAGEKVDMVFRVPKTGSIRTIRFRLATTTTGQTLKGSIYTVAATGVPTTTAYGSMVAGTVTVANSDDNVEKTITLGTDATATEGDLVSATIEWNGTAGSLNIVSMGLGTSTSYVYHNGARQAASPVLAIGYSDGTYEPIIGAIPFTGGVATTSFNVNTATFDEYALRFDVPFKCRLRGIRVGGSFSAGGDIEVINYNGTSAVTGMTLTVDGDYYGTNSREHIFLWASTEELAANTQRYLAIRPTTTTNFGLSRGTLGAAAVWDTVDNGAGWISAKRLNQGSWNETETTIVPYIMPIFDQLDDGAGGGGGAHAATFS